MKKIIAVVCILCLLLCSVGCADDENSSALLTVFDSNGEVVANITSADFPDSELSDPTYRSYVTLALGEAIQAIASTNLCDLNTASQKLFSGTYSLHTALNPSVHSAINSMYTLYMNQGFSVGCSIVDISGNVLAVYSGGEGLSAVEGHAPFSAIKPLSVYAPAMDQGLIDWATTIMDKPYKQLPNSNGVLKDWPENPNKTYTYKNTLLVDCIKSSYNTAAVHTLKKLGVKNSIDYLKNSFDINLDYESNKLTLKGEDEVIGNIAMGYLYQGITPTSLAGYYQIFASGGKYIKPQALMKLEDGSKTIYSFVPNEKQVIKEDTAYIMNQLLRSVVSASGTGAKARIDGVELIGKTGTGDSDGGNWFVGVTPQYSCAVWHNGDRKTKNNAAAMFTEIMNNMPKHTVTEFKSCSAVRKGVYCSESGMLFTSKCSRMHVGYYAQDRKPSSCTAH